MNICCFKIRLGKTPELKYGKTGTAVTTFTGFINERVNGNKKSTALSFVAFGKLAEWIANNVQQGYDANVVCAVQTLTFEVEGKKVYKTQFVINSFDLLNWSVSSKVRRPSEDDDDEDYEDEE